MQNAYDHCFCVLCVCNFISFFFCSYTMLKQMRESSWSFVSSDKSFARCVRCKCKFHFNGRRLDEGNYEQWTMHMYVVSWVLYMGMGVHVWRYYFVLLYFIEEWATHDDKKIPTTRWDALVAWTETILCMHSIQYACTICMYVMYVLCMYVPVCMYECMCVHVVKMNQMYAL